MKLFIKRQLVGGTINGNEKQKWWPLGVRCCLTAVAASQIKI